MNCLLNWCHCGDLIPAIPRTKMINAELPLFSGGFLTDKRRLILTEF